MIRLGRHSLRPHPSHYMSISLSSRWRSRLRHNRPRRKRSRQRLSPLNTSRSSNAEAGKPAWRPAPALKRRNNSTCRAVKRKHRAAALCFVIRRSLCCSGAVPLEGGTALFPSVCIFLPGFQKRGVGSECVRDYNHCETSAISPQPIRGLSGVRSGAPGAMAPLFP